MHLGNAIDKEVKDYISARERDKCDRARLGLSASTTALTTYLLF